MRRLHRDFVLVLAIAAGFSTAAAAENRKVVAGEMFNRGGSWRFWFGEGYRKAWTTPVELPVLDLRTEAGGLTPLREVGSMQTVGLALKGADGHSFTFRKLMKASERSLPKEFLGTPMEAILRDQTAAAHPASPVIVGALARALGIRFYGSRVMIMPDDPALGKFKETFANTVGTFDEYIAPGSYGITEIISTADLWKKWLEGGPDSRVDSRAFLKARLFDLTVGNWDRHQQQWRWAHTPGNPRWEPLPEDADQAFTHYEGKALAYSRSILPLFMRYSGEYPKRIEGLTLNNVDVTRWMPSDLEWPVYEELAREIVAQMTDKVIDDAMREMPAEWYAIDGAQMAKDLKQRRDGLVAFARRFYLHLSDRVEVRGSNQSELAQIRRLDDGSLDVTLAPLGASGAPGEPSYHRLFSPKETKEVRVYLFGGNDRLVTSGPRKGDITLRVLGGWGNDILDDSKSGGTDLRDSDGTNTFVRGPGTSVSEKPWTNPAPEESRPWLEPRAYGHWTVPLIQLWWEPDQAFMIGGGFARTSWGFRQYPWKNMQGGSVIFSTGYKNARVSYFAEARLGGSSTTARIDLKVSGIENLNYFGFGNETDPLEKEQRLVDTSMYSAFPSLRFAPGNKALFYLGAEVQGLKTKGENGTTLIEEEQPYGSGTFHEVKARAGLEYDSRGRATSLVGAAAMAKQGAEAGPKLSGVLVVAEGFYAPKAMDLTESFSGIDGSVAGFLGNRRILLGVRVGGRKLWGAYPFFESATIGGSHTVHGYDTNRFRGDSSVFGNVELRLGLGRRKKPVLPVQWSLIGYYDVGRVWLAGETSDLWHQGYGGGILAEVMGVPGLAIRGSMASSKEGGLHFYATTGYSF
jgi:hypothetical protein